MSHAKRQREIEAQIRDAVRYETGAVSKAEGLVAPLEWLRVEPASGNTTPPVVAVVAADGGNVQFNLRPLRISFVRVATSDNDEPLGELVFPSEIDADELAERLEREVPACIDPLVHAEIDVAGLVRAADRRRDRTAAIREILEWGALINAAWQPRAWPTVIVRDGLLRSIHFDADSFARVRSELLSACAQTGSRIAAVAKSIPGGNELLNLLSATGVLSRIPRGELAALTVPQEVERQLFPASFVSGRALGRLLLVRAPGVTAFTPVETADDSAHATMQVVQALFSPHVVWWPRPGMPLELVTAHERARVSGYDQEHFRKVFLEALAEEDPALHRRVLNAELLGVGGLSVEGDIE